MLCACGCVSVCFGDYVLRDLCRVVLCLAIVLCCAGWFVVCVVCTSHVLDDGSIPCAVLETNRVANLAIITAHHSTAHHITSHHTEMYRKTTINVYVCVYVRV